MLDFAHTYTLVHSNSDVIKKTNPWEVNANEMEKTPALLKDNFKDSYKNRNILQDRKRESKEERNFWSIPISSGCKV